MRTQKEIACMKKYMRGLQIRIERYEENIERLNNKRELDQINKDYKWNLKMKLKEAKEELKECEEELNGGK